jgi:hypothetical protein
MTRCVAGATTCDCQCGHDRLRRRVTVNGTIIDFVLDGQSVVRELHSGSTFGTYLTGPRGPEYRRDQAGTVRWYVFDGLGSVSGEVSPADVFTAARKLDANGAAACRQPGLDSDEPGAIVVPGRAAPRSVSRSLAAGESLPAGLSNPPAAPAPSPAWWQAGLRPLANLAA